MLFARSGIVKTLGYGYLPSFLRVAVMQMVKTTVAHFRVAKMKVVSFVAQMKIVAEEREKKCSLHRSWDSS